MDACSRVALTKVVVRSAPFQRTVEVGRKLEPFTVNVKGGEPAAALVGASDPSAGTGLLAPADPRFTIFATEGTPLRSTNSM
jgi:hypothetical protein